MVREIDINKFKQSYLEKEGCSATILSEFINYIKLKKVSTHDLYEFWRIPYDILTAKELIDSVGEVQTRIQSIIHFKEILNTTDEEKREEASDYLKKMVPELKKELKKLKDIIESDIDRQPPFCSMSELSGCKIIRSKKCLGLNQVKIFDSLMLLVHRENYDSIRELIHEEFENLNINGKEIRILLYSNDPIRNEKSLLNHLKMKSTINLPIIPGEAEYTLTDLRTIFSYTPFIKLEIDPNGDEYLNIDRLVLKTIYSVLFEFFNQNQIKTREAIANFFLWLWVNNLKEDEREIVTKKYIALFSTLFLKNLIMEDAKVTIDFNGVSIEDKKELEGLAEISTEILNAFEGQGFRISIDDVKLWLRVFHDRISSLFGVGDIKIDIHPRKKQYILRFERVPSQFSYIPYMERKFYQFLLTNKTLSEILKMGDMKGKW